MGSPCVMAVGYRDEPSTHDRMRGRRGARPRHIAVARAGAGDAGRRHPDHARWRPPRGDLRRPRPRHPEEHAEEGPARRGHARPTSASGRDTPDERRAQAAAVLLDGWSPNRDRSPATPRSAATRGCPTRSGSRIPATPRSCSARRSTPRSRSNDPVRNPHETVLERLRRDLKLTRGAGRDVRQLGRLQRHRRAHRGRHDDQRRLRSRWPSTAPISRCSTSCRRRPRAPWNDARLRRVHVPAGHGLSGEGAAARAVPLVQRHRQLGARGPLRSRCSTPTR